VAIIVHPTHFSLVLNRQPIFPENQPIFPVDPTDTEVTIRSSNGITYNPNTDMYIEYAESSPTTWVRGPAFDSVTTTGIGGGTVTGLSDNTTYYFRIVEVNATEVNVVSEILQEDTLQRSMVNEVYTVPGTYTWSAPNSETVTVELQGGDGGDYQSNRIGGNGGYLCVDVDVIGGVEITIIVGGPGEKNTNSSYGSQARHGGGGGGGTGFKASTETWMVIAGGGGGAADTGNGGAGGIPGVFDGTDGSGSGNGQKGTTTAGGAGGSGRRAGVAGIQYVGGRAGTEKPTAPTHRGSVR
jgi:hypothetical protein